MEEKELKPSVKQRLIFALVAAILLGSSIAAYVLIVMGSGNVNYSKMTMNQLEDAYSKKMAELDAEAEALSGQYFEEFKSFKSNVKAFNSAKANAGSVEAKDLKEGDGDTITSESNYSAYYVGFCSDEEVFDSSFDDYDEPTSLKSPLSVEPSSLIEGWYQGTEGMKIGGVREITIPGALAYGETYEICGGKNSPLKFIVMAIEKNENIAKITEELDKIYSALSDLYAQNYSSYDEYDDSGDDVEVVEVEDDEE